MTESVVRAEVKAVIPASGGCAVFLGNEEKSFVIYIDQMVGMAIAMFMKGIPKERPLTHDLILSIFTAYDIRVDRIVINEFRDNIYYARLVLIAENELDQRKIMEIDARPSDCLALAVKLKAPIYIGKSVWDQASDDTHILKAMQEKGKGGLGEWGVLGGDEAEEDDSDDVPF